MMQPTRFTRYQRIFAAAITLALSTATTVGWAQNTPEPDKTITISKTFHDAVTQGNFFTINRALDSGADINAMTPDNETALIETIQTYGFWSSSKNKPNIRKYSNVLRLLLDREADVDAKDTSGRTALMWSAQLGMPDIMRLLLAHKANVNAVTTNGDTALTLATLFGRADSVRLLLANGADLNAAGMLGTPLMCAVSQPNNGGIAMLLVKSGADINQCTKIGTALTVATQAGNMPMAKQLVAKGANIEAADERANTPLLTITQLSTANINALKLLLNLHANINAKNSMGETPLMHAAQAGNATAVKLLLGQHPDCNLTNTAGENALTLALKNGHNDIAHLLKVAGTVETAQR